MYAAKLLLPLLVGGCSAGDRDGERRGGDTGRPGGETADDTDAGDTHTGDSGIGETGGLGKSEVRVPMRFVELADRSPLAGLALGAGETDEDGRISVVLPEGPAAVDIDDGAHLPARVDLYGGDGTSWVPDLPLLDGATRTALWDVAGLPAARDTGLLLVVAARGDGAGGWGPAEGLTLDVVGRYAGSVAQAAAGFVPGNTVPEGGSGVIAFLGTGETVEVTAPVEADCQVWAASSLEPYAVPVSAGGATVVALRCGAPG